MRTRRIMSAALFILSASCAGGGGGCTGCGAGPIPGGFPQEAMVPNGGTARVTRSGLDFVATNLGTVASSVLGANTLTFPIPTSTQSAVGVSLTICPGGPKPNATPPLCTAEINIAASKLKVDATNPNVVKLTGTIPVVMKKLPLAIGAPFNFTVYAGLGKNATCNNGNPVVPPKDVPILISIPVVQETITPRKGYAKLDLANATIDPQLVKEDAQVCWDCVAPFQGICDGLASFVKDLVFNTVVDGVKDQLKLALQDFFCTTPTIGVTPICPTGSQPNADKSKCMYTARPSECVPTPLGFESRLDLSETLQTFSPGTTGGFDIAIAGGGSLDPAPGSAADNVGYSGHTPNGLTLGLLGGAMPAPVSACVPQAKLTAPAGIGRPDELRANIPAGWPVGQAPPDLGIALAGRFLEYALGTSYNSGMLCLNITTDTLPDIRSGLLSVLVPSLPKLTLEQSDAALAIVTKPKNPPKIAIGTGKDIKTDPLLKLTLPKFDVDFYVWSYDRYVRIFSLSGDLVLPINLSTAIDAQKNPNGGLLVQLGEIAYTNAVVTANDLLLEDPKVLAAGVSGIIGAVSAQVTGAIPALDISAALSAVGLGVNIPATGGIVKLTKGSDDFVALFGKLKLGAKGTSTKMQPLIAILEKEVDPSAMTLQGADRTRFPKLTVSASSNVPGAEYSYAIDGSTRSPWMLGDTLRIQNDSLFMQGKHKLRVWARQPGEDGLEDPEPAEVPFTIDVLPPRVELEGRVLRARDIVSSALEVRTIDTNGITTDWRAMDRNGAVSFLNLEGTVRRAEVRDEEGNVSGLDLSLLSGTNDSVESSSCATRTPSNGNSAGGFASVVALLGAFMLRRKPKQETSVAKSSNGKRGDA